VYNYILNNRISGICAVLLEMYADNYELFTREEYVLIRDHFTLSTKHLKRDGNPYYFTIGEKVRRLMLINSLIKDIERELESRQLKPNTNGKIPELRYLIFLYTKILNYIKNNQITGICSVIDTLYNRRIYYRRLSIYN